MPLTHTLETGFSCGGASLQQSFAGGEEKRYFAPNDATKRGSEPRRGAAPREYRDTQGSGGVVPKHRVAAANGLESILFSLIPRRELYFVLIAVEERPFKAAFQRAAKPGF